MTNKRISTPIQLSSSSTSSPFDAHASLSKIAASSTPSSPTVGNNTHLLTSSMPHPSSSTKMTTKDRRILSSSSPHRTLLITIVCVGYNIIFIWGVTYYYHYYYHVAPQESSLVVVPQPTNSSKIVPPSSIPNQQQKQPPPQQQQQQQQQQAPEESVTSRSESLSSSSSSTTTTTTTSSSSSSSWKLIQEVEEKRRLFSARDSHQPHDYDKPSKVIFGDERHLLHSEYYDTDQYPSSDYAYAFLIGGIDPSRHYGYRGFLYSVIVATSILRNDYSSIQDIWLMIQLVDHHNSTTTSILELPIEDQILLYESQIHIWYLPPLRITDGNHNEPSFGEAVYDKFRILQMIEYRRVMFIDADIIPTNSLDYLFYLTDINHNTTSSLHSLYSSLQETQQQSSSSIQFRSNMIIATRGEPCNAGLFILRPHETAYQTVLQIVDRLYQYIIDTNQSYPYFSVEYGWGHSFLMMNDYWTAVMEDGNGWNYHASHSDQGLLYYYTKYYQQDVTIIIGTTIENWIHNMTLFVQDDLTQTSTYGYGHTLPIKIQEYNSDIHLRLYSDNISKSIFLNGGCDRYFSKVRQPNYVYDIKISKMGKPHKYYDFACYPPYSNYQHTYGTRKPWQQAIDGITYWLSRSIPTPDNHNKDSPSRIIHHNTRNIVYKNCYWLWFHVLRDIIWRNHQMMNNKTKYDDNNDYNARNDFFMKWWMPQVEKNIRQSPLGYMATWKEFTERLIEYQNRRHSSSSNSSSSSSSNSNVNLTDHDHSMMMLDASATVRRLQEKKDKRKKRKKRNKPK